MLSFIRRNALAFLFRCCSSVLILASTVWQYAVGNAVELHQDAIAKIEMVSAQLKITSCKVATECFQVVSACCARLHVTMLAALNRTRFAENL